MHLLGPSGRQPGLEPIWDHQNQEEWTLNLVHPFCIMMDRI
jgi:hypothetical protein